MKNRLSIFTFCQNALAHVYETVGIIMDCLATIQIQGARLKCAEISRPVVLLEYCVYPIYSGHLSFLAKRSLSFNFLVINKRVIFIFS